MYSRRKLRQVKRVLNLEAMPVTGSNPLSCCCPAAGKAVQSAGGGCGGDDGGLGGDVRPPSLPHGAALVQPARGVDPGHCAER